MTTSLQTSPQTSPPPPKHNHEKAITLALRLAHAENALRAFSSGQVDAIIDPDGKTYLLRPAQEHLRQNERRLQAIIESAPDVITVVNRGGVIVSQNRAARHVFGYEPEELVGSRLFEHIHEEDFPRLYAAFFNVSEDFLERATAQFRHRVRDGSYRMVEATVAKLHDGSSASVVISLRPVTSPPAAHTEPPLREAVLIEGPVGKDRFLAMLSHELRTPLTPVLLGVVDLQEDERFAEARPTLTMMRRNIEVQARLLDELTDYSTVGHHKVRLRPEAIDAHEAIGFVLEICQSEIDAAQIDVRLDLAAAESMVLADSVRLQQVMWNLVKNAVKFSTPGSSISITSANDTPGHLTIEFTDHGRGIEPALLPLMFDSFQQGDDSQQYQNGGLGLGLFIAKGLTEALGGTLTAASQGRGTGATFRLSLMNSTAGDMAQANRRAK